MYARYISKDDAHAFCFDVFANYYVTFDANGGEIVSPSVAEKPWTSVTQDAATKIVEVGSPYGELPATIRTGYTFDGWVTDSRLPVGYQEVEYIEATGTQYIDTGYKPYQSTFGYDIDLIFYNDLSNTRTAMAVFDAWNSDNACFSLGGNYKGKDKGNCNCYIDIGWVAGEGHYELCLKHRERGKVSIINNGDYDEETKKSTCTVTSPLFNGTFDVIGNKTVKHSLPVFATWNGSQIQEHSHVVLYSLKIFEVNTPVRDFVPAVWQGGETTYSKGGTVTSGILPEDTVGLYDLVGKVFYINSGSGKFKTGNPVGATGAIISDATIMDITRDHTILAKWNPNIYTLTLNANDGSGSTRAEGNTEDGLLDVIYDDYYTDLPVLRRVGYSFDGWFDGDIEYKNEDQVRITEDTTLTAHWTPNTYTVSFDANGGILSDAATMTVEFDNLYGTLPTPEREGYTFTGWVATRLAAGYQEVEYIEATGTQYIDTGYKPYQSTFGYDIDLIFYNDLSNTRTAMAVFDAWNSDSACFSLGGNFKPGGCYIDIGWVAGGANTRSCLNYGERGKVSVINNGDYDEEMEKSTCTVTSPLFNDTFDVIGNKTVGHSLPLFATWDGSRIKEESHIRLYSLRIFEVNTPVRDFVPAVWQGGETTYSQKGTKKTDELAAGTPGLFDRVDKVFYINSGTSGSESFSVGETIDDIIVTEDSNVTIPSDHTLYAVWEPAPETLTTLSSAQIDPLALDEELVINPVEFGADEDLQEDETEILPVELDSQEETPIEEPSNSEEAPTEEPSNSEDTLIEKSSNPEGIPIEDDIPHENQDIQF